MQKHLDCALSNTFDIGTSVKYTSTALGNRTSETTSGVKVQHKGTTITEQHFGHEAS